MVKDKNPTVSVIIPTYNRAHLVGRAIRSVLNQTYQDFELIVVDDGSTDNTEEVIRSFDDDRIRYIRHDQNKGGAAARNTGIKAARGEYIAFLDSDDESLPENLEKKVKVFNSAFSDVGLVYSKVIRDLGDYEYTTQKRGIKAQESMFEYLFLHQGVIQTSTLLARSSLLGDILFDEDLDKHQDWDFVIRLNSVTKFHFLDEPLAIWHNEQVLGPGRISEVPNPDASRRFVEKYRSEFTANRRVFAGLMYQLGVWCLRGMNVMDGRKFIQESIALYPFRVKPIFLYLSTYLGKGFITFLFNLLEMKIRVSIRLTN